MVLSFSIDFPDISALRQLFNGVGAHKDLIGKEIFMERLLAVRV